MPENRDFAWLRKTLCDEIDAVRSGKADHSRAKSVAALAAAALKSVEVEAMLRQQQADLSGTDAPAIGALPLHGDAPALEDHSGAEDEPQAPEPPTDEPQDANGFKAGDRVMTPNGKRGTVKSVTAAGRIDVEEDGGHEYPYSAKHLEPLTKPREPIRSPVAPPGPVPRFVAGRVGSGSR